MFKYFFKKGTYNLIIEKYNSLLHIFKDEATKGFRQIPNYKITINLNSNNSDITINNNSPYDNQDPENVRYFIGSPAFHRHEMLTRYKKGLATPTECLIVERDLAEEAVIKHAEQKYYETVFNCVCQDVANNLKRFNDMLMINISNYNLPDILKSFTIYEFIYYCQYGEKIDFTYECEKIAIYVNDLKSECISDIKKQLTVQ